VRRQDAHDDLVKALEGIADWAERPRTTTPRAAIGDIARAAIAKAGVKPRADRQPQKPADAR
jgi:predicted transcriptional regulator